MKTYRLLVQRDRLDRYHPAETVVPVPVSGEALLQVERFGLTANNVTYGAAGDMLGYWQFFPAELPDGCIPVWGIGQVVASTVPALAEGQRYYGYFPMGTELVVTPERLSDQGFTDGAAHRAGLPPVYNRYVPATPANGFLPGQEDHQIVYRPLFTTSFLLDDYLCDQSDFGSDQILLTSASSKTSFGTAFQLKRRGRRVIGLTSEHNRAFVEGLGLYDAVCSYGEVAALPREKTALVDVAGNRPVVAEIHGHLGEALCYSGMVGMTHWGSSTAAMPSELPGPAPSMFFAPDQVEKRIGDWGSQGFQARLGEASAAFAEAVAAWVRLEVFEGPEGLLTAYAEVLKGASPDKAFVIRP